MANPNPNSASQVDESPESENQEKMENVYFGVFFDAIDNSAMANMIGDRGEYMRMGEEKVSEVKDSSIYKTVDKVGMWTKYATDVLPDNPVSKAVKKGLEIKDTVENKANEYIGKVEGINDSIANKAGDIPTGTDGGTAEDMVGGRSVISKMEPCYIGDYYNTNYNFRIYTKGAVTNNELRREETTELDDEARKHLGEKVAKEAVEAIKTKMPQIKKFSLHFDVFGYEKDPAVTNFIPEIDQFKQNPNVNKLSTDYKGIYKKFYDKNEVLDDLGITCVRFRDLSKKL